MARFSKECIDAALDKLTNFTKDEVETYLSEVFVRSREYNDLGSQASINLAIKEINKQKLEALLEDSTISANNAKKFQKLSNKIKNENVTLDDISIRSRSDKNKDLNIESAQRAKYNEFHKIFHDSLTSEETKFVTDHKNSIDIGKAIDGKEASAMAKKIADKHLKLVDSIQANMITSNAMPIHALNKRRQISATHDRKKILNPGKSPYKIISSKEKYSTNEARSHWMDEIKKHLDIEETYKKIGAINKDGQVDMERIDKHLSRTFDNIVNGRNEYFTRSGVKNDFEAIKKRQRMFFVWKDTESWLKYNEKYGSGNYYSALTSYIRSSANKVGTAEMFGDDSRNMFMNLMNLHETVSPKSAGWKKRTEQNFKHITGIDQAAVNPTLAAFGSNLRTLTGMARLGNIGVMSMGDVVKGAAHVSKFGFGFWKPLVNNVLHMFNNPLTDNEERRKIAQMFKLNLDSHLGYMGKFVDATTVGESMSKFTNAFYKANLMHGLDKGNKISVMHMMSKGLSDASEKGFKDLGPELQKQLSKYGIAENEWELLRTKNEDGLFTTDNVEKISDSELKSLQVGDNEKSSLYDIRNDLSRKVYTLFDVASNTAVGQPDTYMKAFLLGGTQSGTAWGEALRALTQFKAFPLQHIDRMYINNFKDSDGVKAKSVYFMNMFAASFGLNMLSNALNYYAQGKSMPDINRMSNPEKLKFMMEGFDSNIGLLYKGFSNSYPGKFKAMYLMSSPSTDFVGNILDIVANSGMALTGDKKSWKRGAKSAKNAAKSIMPTSTIPILSPYLNEMFGDKSYLQPGQKQIYGK
jgi:hypothetical protein